VKGGNGSAPALTLPSWYCNPLGMISPIQAAEAYHRHQRLLLYADMSGLQPTDISESMFKDMEVEFAENPQAQAEAELATLTFAGEQVVLHERVLQVLAAKLQTSKRYLQAATPYLTLSAALHDRLGELDQDAQHTEYYSLDWLINVFVPECAILGINGLEALWQPGAKSKALLLKDYLGASLAAAGIDETSLRESETPIPLPAKLDKQVRQMVAGVAKGKMTVGEFKEAFGKKHHTGADLPKLKGFNFLLAHGGALVIYYHTEAERMHLETAIHGEIKLGTSADLTRLQEAAVLTRTRQADPKPLRKGKR